MRHFLCEAVRGRASLLRAALAPGFDRTPPRRLMALSMVLLDFPSWQALKESGFTSQGAAAVVGEALAALVFAVHKEKDA